jgi:hypothetical protein
LKLKANRFQRGTDFRVATGGQRRQQPAQQLLDLLQRSTVVGVGQDQGGGDFFG